MLKTETIVITPEILALISKIDEFKGAWQALGSLAPERLLALRRVATIESESRLTVSYAEQQTGANRATIKAHLAKLVSEGHLIKQGVGRGTWYVAS